jgi:hypothetical protein
LPALRLNYPLEASRPRLPNGKRFLQARLPYYFPLIRQPVLKQVCAVVVLLVRGGTVSRSNAAFRMHLSLRYCRPLKKFQLSSITDLPSVARAAVSRRYDFKLGCCPRTVHIASSLQVVDNAPRPAIMPRQQLQCQLQLFSSWCVFSAQAHVSAAPVLSSFWWHASAGARCLLHCATRMTKASSIPLFGAVYILE